MLTAVVLFWFAGWAVPLAWIVAEERLARRRFDRHVDQALRLAHPSQRTPLADEVETFLRTHR